MIKTDADMSLLQHSAKGELRLELLQVLFRHGDRTPLLKELIPNDPIPVSRYEPWGLGQLTNQGKMREYRIGEILRKRYDKFLGDVYRPNDVYAQSTDMDRTKMSLQLVLAGLYPPKPGQTWSDNLAWMPVPTHYLPEKVDHLMKPDQSSLYTEALAKIRNSEEVVKKASAFKDFFKFLGEKINVDIQNTRIVYEFYSRIAAQKSMGIEYPDWCTDEVFKKIQTITELEYEIRSYTDQLKQLNGGTLVRTFIENIKKNEINETARKIYLYSGHETNIAGFARAHNFVEPRIPNFGSAIIMEKYRNETGEAFVKLFLWTGVTEELIPYKLEGCDEICPLTEYERIMENVLPSDLEIHYMWNSLSKEDLYKLYEDKVKLN